MADNTLTLRFQCQSVATQRGPVEHVSLTPVAGAPENARIWRGHPVAGFSLVIDNPEGQGVLDPEMDYIVTLTPVPPLQPTPAQ